MMCVKEWLTAQKLQAVCRVALRIWMGVKASGIWAGASTSARRHGAWLWTKNTGELSALHRLKAVRLATSGHPVGSLAGDPRVLPLVVPEGAQLSPRAPPTCNGWPARTTPYFLLLMSTHRFAGAWSSESLHHLVSQVEPHRRGFVRCVAFVSPSSSPGQGTVVWHKPHASASWWHRRRW